MTHGKVVFTSVTPTMIALTDSERDGHVYEIGYDMFRPDGSRQFASRYVPGKDELGAISVLREALKFEGWEV